MTLTLTKQTDTVEAGATRRGVMYLRVASADERDQREGIAQQRADCRREAERLGAVITEEFIDLGASGNNNKRGGLRRLLAAVRQRPVRYVIVRDQTRLARNQADDTDFRGCLEEAGVTIASAERSP